MVVSWERIPPEILNEVRELRDHSKGTNREASLTVCRNSDRAKVYTGGSEKGDNKSTKVAECSTKFGKGQKIGDFHTHPVDDDDWGGSIMPSDGDMTGIMEDAFRSETRHIGCITNHYAPFIECIQPKKVPDRKKYNEYSRALDRSLKRRRDKDYLSFSEPFYLENVAKDFDFSMYDRENGKRINRPEPKQVIKCALGKHNRRFRKAVREMEKGAFCNMIQDFTQPQDDRVGAECREEIRTRKILGGLIKY